MKDSVAYSKKALLDIFGTEASLVKQLGKPESTNEIWLVKTQKKPLILKILKPESKQNVFWKGLNHLFGFSFEHAIATQSQLSDYLSKISNIKIPKVIFYSENSENVLQKPYVVYEFLEGEPIEPGTQSEEIFLTEEDTLKSFGFFIGSIHYNSHSTDFGCLHKPHFPLTEFPEKLVHTIEYLAGFRRARDNPDVQNKLSYFLSAASRLEPPQEGTLSALDLWPNQFLFSEKENLLGLMDIESYVFAPKELDLVLIELWMQKTQYFKEGYFEAMGQSYWPDLEEVRELYRFFLYLLYDCPEQGLEDCLNSRVKFPQGDRVKSRLTGPKPRPPGYPQNPMTPFDE